MISKTQANKEYSRQAYRTGLHGWDGPAKPVWRWGSFNEYCLI